MKIFKVKNEEVLERLRETQDYKETLLREICRTHLQRAYNKAHSKIGIAEAEC